MNQNIFYRLVVTVQKIVNKIFIVLGWWHPHKVYFNTNQSFFGNLSDVSRMYLARVFIYFFRTFLERILPNFIDPEKAQISRKSGFH
jgi:hypothetical protein